MSLETLLSKLWAWAKTLVHLGEKLESGSTAAPTPSIDPKVPLDEPASNQYRPVITGNIEPKILRITDVNPEKTGDVVGPDKDVIHIGRKGKIFTALRSEVVCGFTVKVLGDGEMLPNSKGGNISLGNVNRDHRVDIDYPGTNGYVIGTYDAAILLYNQNGKLVDRRDFTLIVG